MDYRSLSNVLGILRLIKAGKSGTSAAQLIQSWASIDREKVDEAAVLKVASYLIEEIDEATTVIVNSQLADEAKHGVLSALQGMSACFAITGIHTTTNSFIKDLNGSISNFVILLSASGIPTNNQQPDEATDLAIEVEELIKAFDDETLDPIVRDLGKRHLQILATMLKHVSIFGMEAALATYFELVLKIRRADANTSPEQKKATEPLMKRIDGWQSKLSTLDKMWNHGARWISRGKSAAALLGFFSPGP